LLAALVLSITAPRLLAANSEEDRAFKAATGAFRDGFWARAESELASFVQTFTNSTHLAEAILLQAEARLQLTNYPGAIALLTANLNQAGAWADQFVFWLGEAQFRKGDYASAAETFAKVGSQFPASSLRLESKIREAIAWSKRPDWPRVIALLQQADGVFQAAARANAADELVVRGYLLLGEAQLARQDYKAGEAALVPLSALKLAPKLAWQREYLRSRLLLADNRRSEALDCSTNLPPLALAAQQRDLQAETALFQARLNELLGHDDEAVAAYRTLLADGFAAEPQGQALLKIANLSSRHQKLADAAGMLDQFLAKFPDAPAADVALLTLGELRLRQFAAASGTNSVTVAVTNSPGCSNCLPQAFTALRAFATRFPQSQFFGRGQLALGWCYWLSNQMPESQAAFQMAVLRLPPATDRATAFFKLADAQFQQKNFAGALSNYTAIIEQCATLPEVRSNLFEPALYQAVRAGLAGGDLPAATNALAKILAWHPDSFRTEGAVLLTGQHLGRQDPARARQILSDFLQAAPQASLRAEVELAIARTYEQQGDWPVAIEHYDSWLDVFTNHPAQPRAEFWRAQANFQAHRETNALAGFNRFIAQNPTNEFTPLAQWWVATYLLRTGNAFDAEKGFNALSRTVPPSELTWHAGLMAGRAAIAWQGWNNAPEYFLRVHNDTNCPAELRAEALFAYGDCLMARGSPNKGGDYVEAFKVFTRVSDQFPSNRLAVLALGRKAECSVQLHDYVNATNTFQQVIDSPAADVSARSIAKAGLAATLENMAQETNGAEQAALLSLALNNCLDVFYDKILRPGEARDLFWVKETGLKAARLAETLQQWPQAVRVYEELYRLLPPLRAKLDEKLLKAREQAGRGVASSRQ
jgi:TolA-binding protein